MTKMTENDHVIKDTVDIYCFAKIDVKQHKDTCSVKLPPISLKRIEKFSQFSFKTLENFSNSKPQPPGSENVRIPGCRPGGRGEGAMVRLGID